MDHLVYLAYPAVANQKERDGPVIETYFDDYSNSCLAEAYYLVNLSSPLKARKRNRLLKGKEMRLISPVLKKIACRRSE